MKREKEVIQISSIEKKKTKAEEEREVRVDLKYLNVNGRGQRVSLLYGNISGGGAMEEGGLVHTRRG